MRFSATPQNTGAQSPADELTAATIGLNLVSGVLTGFALLATTGVLEALFAAGPTPHRVRAALPSLIVVAAAVAARAGLQAAAGWAQARLQPQVDRLVEIRLLDTVPSCLAGSGSGSPPRAASTGQRRC